MEMKSLLLGCCLPFCNGSRGTGSEAPLCILLSKEGHPCSYLVVVAVPPCTSALK